MLATCSVSVAVYSSRLESLDFMTQLPDPNSTSQPETPADFSSQAPTQESGKSNNAIWIVLGCIGCGCLSIPLLGVVAAIILPVFFNQANKAMQSEAKFSIGAINRGQQAHYLDKTSFASSLDELGLGIQSETLNYRYSVELQPDGNGAIVFAEALKPDLPSYTGAVFAVGDVPNNAELLAGICETEDPSTTAPAAPTLDDEGEIECALGSELIY